MVDYSRFDITKKIKVIACFSGTGKTYFCQHNPGWADIDEEPFVRSSYAEEPFFHSIWCYRKYGYKILTCASPFALYMLDREEFDVTLVLPSPAMKDEIIDRVLNQRQDTEWGKQLQEKWYDEFYKVALKKPFKKIYLHEGQYLSDIKDLLEQEYQDD